MAIFMHDVRVCGGTLSGYVHAICFYSRTVAGVSGVVLIRGDG